MNTAITANNIKLKRAYEHPAPDDGIRILIDRLWLRGVKRAEAAIDHWIKDVAPSAELRRWFAHDPTRWQQFQHRYRQEQKGHRKKSMNCGITGLVVPSIGNGPVPQARRVSMRQGRVDHHSSPSNKRLKETAMWRVSGRLTKLDFKLANLRQELGPINLVSGTCVSRRALLK